LIRLSIIIVNYNVKDLLEQCINSIFSATKNIDCEIIIVDNNSFDGSAEFLYNKFSSNPRVKIFASEINLGFAKANNLGVKNAAGKYILILNPDTVLKEDTLDKTIEFFEKNPDAGIVTCKLIMANGKLDLACRRSFPSPSVALYRIIGLSKIFPKSRVFGKYNLTFLSEEEVNEVDAVAGAFMLTSKEIFDKANGFDEEYFMYGEDIDLCFRIKKLGFKILYYPGTSIIHYKGESTKKSSLSYVNNFYGAMQIFVRKNLNTKFRLLDAVIKLSITYRAVVSYLRRLVINYYPFIIDLILIISGMLIAIRQRFEYFPIEAYLPVIIIYTSIWVLTLFISGTYVKRDIFSLLKPLIGLLIGFFINSSITYFFNEYAFSRVVVLRTTFNAFVLIELWRIIANIYHYSRKKSFFRTVRTLIVGKNTDTEEFINKLRRRVDSEYDIVGFILTDSINRNGFIGNLNNIKDVIVSYNIKNILFAKGVLSNKVIFDLMWDLKNLNLNFKILSSDNEIILGKTALDKIDDIYLMQIEYNINKKFNIFVKRLFDFILGIILLLTVFPVVFIISKLVNYSSKDSKVLKKLLLIPGVLTGKYSLVGRATWDYTSTGKQFLGKNGLTGLVQINYYKNLTEDEIEFYNYYYAKNQSIALDMEIILRTISLFVFRRKLPRL